MDAEKIIIGSLLINSEAIDDVYGKISPDMFQSDFFGSVYHQFEVGAENKEPVNILTIVNALRSDSLPEEVITKELTSCVNDTPTSAFLMSAVKQLKNDYTEKKMNAIFDMSGKSNDTQKNLKDTIAELEDLIEDEEDDGISLAEVARREKDNYFTPKNKSRYKLGFREIDSKIARIDGGDMIVIGARPAVGKSAFALQIARKFANDGLKVAYFNLEMSEKQIYERAVATSSGLELNRIRLGTDFKNREQEMFREGNSFVEQEENLVILSKTNQVSQIRRKVKNGGFDVVIIDYLQLLTPDRNRGGNRFAEVGDISRDCKELAMEFNIPIFVLSQLNRVSTQKEDKEPSMSELRESGCIEQDASVILLLWNVDEDDTSKKGLKVAKARNGTTGKIEIPFDGKRMMFGTTNRFVEVTEQTEIPF